MGSEETCVNCKQSIGLGVWLVHDTNGIHCYCSRISCIEPFIQHHREARIRTLEAGVRCGHVPEFDGADICGLMSDPKAPTAGRCPRHVTMVTQVL